MSNLPNSENQNDLVNLFTRTSQTLRDYTIDNLNDEIKNMKSISNPKVSLIGCKIKIKEHLYNFGNKTYPECLGIVIETFEYKALCMSKINNIYRIKSVDYDKIEILDSKLIKFYDSL